MGELIEHNGRIVLDEQYMFLTLISMCVSILHRYYVNLIFACIKILFVV